MRVFTYYTPLKGRKVALENALIELWATSWKRAGWHPCVLTAADLPQDPASTAMLKAFNCQPSINRPGLDGACFARWLAVSIQGGGFMCDYDVINYGFPPREVSELTVYERHVPCLVSGSAEEFLRMCKIFATYRTDSLDQVGSRLDTSDMKILIRRPDAYVQRTDCIEYTHPGWEEATAVHFSNFAMKPRSLVPRHQHIPLIRSFL